MRTPKLNTMSRRRTQRPDSQVYRQMRKRSGLGRRRMPLWLIALLLAAGVAVFVWLRR